VWFGGVISLLGVNPPNGKIPAAGSGVEHEKEVHYGLDAVFRPILFIVC
jgi:hypothetical protein